MTPPGPARRSERGGASAIEVLLLVPAVLLFFGLVVAGARIAMAQDAVQTAAGAAARAASLERNPGTAQSVASQVAAVDLNQATCASQSVSVSAAGFAVPVGTKADVSATVSCTVSFTDVLIPMPGSMTFTRTATSPLDTFRGRTSGFMISEGVSGTNLGGG